MSRYEYFNLHKMPSSATGQFEFAVMNCGNLQSSVKNWDDRCAKLSNGQSNLSKISKNRLLFKECDLWKIHKCLHLQYLYGFEVLHLLYKFSDAVIGISWGQFPRSILWGWRTLRMNSQKYKITKCEYSFSESNS